MLKEIPVVELVASPTNPRKTFDPVKLQELAASITEKGVLSPLVVRPCRPRPPWTKEGQDGVTHEVVAGERRFRAAGMAGLTTVPCIVHELTDVEVLEIQTVENLQRDDLHPLEEAEGYAALMKEAGYDVAQIARRVGKSEKYVYDRLKLLQLVPSLKEVFLAGEISVGHAILLARLSWADQERANGSAGTQAQLAGLWAHDYGEHGFGLELNDRRRRKPVSIRELETWIDRNVRFRPGEVDLPNLFPETAVALRAAEAEELKVVKITRDFRVPDGARDLKERTIGRQGWKRADGEPDQEPWDRKKAKPSKTCEHSVMGVVVAGPGRGEAFRVCVAKKKCTVHWAAEQKAANEQGAPNGAGTKGGRQNYQAEQSARALRWEEERRREDAERARWKTAAPKLLDALAEAIKATPAGNLADIVLDKVRPPNAPKKSKHMGGEPSTIADAVRLAAWFVLSDTVTNAWRAHELAPKALKRVGIDAKKIVDQVAPKKKAEKKKAASKKKADPKKPGARARRRTKKAGGDAVQAPAGGEA